MWYGDTARKRSAVPADQGEMAIPSSVEYLCCALRSIRASILHLSADNAAKDFGTAERVLKEFLVGIGSKASEDEELHELLIQSAVHGLAAALADFWHDIGEVSQGLMPASSGALYLGDRDGNHAETDAKLIGHCLYLSSVVCLLLSKCTVVAKEKGTQLEAADNKPPLKDASGGVNRSLHVCFAARHEARRHMVSPFLTTGPGAVGASPRKSKLKDVKLPREGGISGSVQGIRRLAMARMVAAAAEVHTCFIRCQGIPRLLIATQNWGCLGESLSEALAGEMAGTASGTSSGAQRGSRTSGDKGGQPRPAFLRPMVAEVKSFVSCVAAMEVTHWISPLSSKALFNVRFNVRFRFQHR